MLYFQNVYISFKWFSISICWITARDLAVDEGAKRVFYIDYYADSIKSIDYNGDDEQTHVDGLFNPDALVVDKISRWFVCCFRVRIGVVLFHIVLYIQRYYTINEKCILCWAYASI